MSEPGPADGLPRSTPLSVHPPTQQLQDKCSTSWPGDRRHWPPPLRSTRTQKSLGSVTSLAAAPPAKTLSWVFPPQGVLLMLLQPLLMHAPAEPIPPQSPATTTLR